VVAALLAPAVVAPPPVRVPTSPVLAGPGVLWAEQAGQAIVVRLKVPGSSSRTVYRFALGPDGGSVALAASPARAVVVATREDCGDGGPCAFRQVILGGPLRGPLRPVLMPATCAVQQSAGPVVDISETLVAYTDARCGPSIAAIDLTGRDSRVVVHMRGENGCCTSVRVAGRCLAWNGWHWVTVYDLAARRVLYRAAVAADDLVRDFDLQPDGKLAVLMRKKIAWFSRSAPRAHFLPLVPATTPERIRFAHDRIAFVRGDASGDPLTLSVSRLDGQTTTVTTFDATDRLTNSLESDFDFDGSRLTWAGDHIASTRVECPGPGVVGAPCITHETGVTTIWLARLGASPTALVRLPLKR
jgi:hypothetical protein